MDITQLLEEMNTYINESLKDRINAIIKDEDLPATVIIEKDGKVGVEVDGDWKHEHAYFTNKMGSHDLWPEDHEIVGDGESDCYTAIYYFSDDIKEDFKQGEMLKNMEDIKAIYWNPNYDEDQIRDELQIYKNEHNLTDGDIAWVIGQDSYDRLFYSHEGLDDGDYEDFDESLKDYKEVGKILQNKEDGGFNVAEGNDPLLLKDQPTLKQLLTELAKYM